MSGMLLIPGDETVNKIEMSLLLKHKKATRKGRGVGYSLSHS